MKTIYAVCFLKHNENHEIAYHYFEKIEKAQKYLEETSKKYKNDLVMWNKNESGLWSFKISLETFYMNEAYKDKYDRWFIDEITVE